MPASRLLGHDSSDVAICLRKASRTASEAAPVRAPHAIAANARIAGSRTACRNEVIAAPPCASVAGGFATAYRGRLRRRSRRFITRAGAPQGAAVARAEVHDFVYTAPQRRVCVRVTATQSASPSCAPMPPQPSTAGSGGDCGLALVGRCWPTILVAKYPIAWDCAGPRSCRAQADRTTG